MVIYEDIGNGLVKAFSDKNMMIRGGYPEGLYIDAVDPKELDRTYEETDIPVPEQYEEDISDNFTEDYTL